MERLWETAGEPRFSVVWRGYDRQQVKERMRGLGPYGDPSGEPGESVAAEDGHRFDVVLRGYDLREVDRYFEQFGR